eukprot:4333835-Prymnesium_polylepis.1
MANFGHDPIAVLQRIGVGQTPAEGYPLRDPSPSANEAHDDEAVRVSLPPGLHVPRLDLCRRRRSRSETEA